MTGGLQRALAFRRAPQTIIVVFRDRFELHHCQLHKGRYKVKRYPIAVGNEGNTTPRGQYFISNKNHKPDWRIPNNPDFARESWGKIVPFESPVNPFEGGFMALEAGEGVGIHGVRFDPQLGKRASHGCIRMGTPDLLHIWDRTPLGTPVAIV